MILDEEEVTRDNASSELQLAEQQLKSSKGSVADGLRIRVKALTEAVNLIEEEVGPRIAPVVAILSQPKRRTLHRTWVTKMQGIKTMGLLQARRGNYRNVSPRSWPRRA